jgi:hypothetical protein
VRTEGTLGTVEVHRLETVEGDAVVLDVGIGRAGDDLDLVAEIAQFDCQIAGVDPLAAGVGVPPVSEDGDTEATVDARCVAASGMRGGGGHGRLPSPT